MNEQGWHMNRYTPKPGSHASIAIETLGERAAPMTAHELSPIIGVPVRQVHGQLSHAVSRGALGKGVDRNGAVVFWLPGEIQFAPQSCTGSVSVRRPNVARDVWAYARGAA